jgi:hypothetical protein
MRMSTRHRYAHSILLSTSEKLGQLDFEIHEVGYKEHLTIDGDVNHKYNTHAKFWI